MIKRHYEPDWASLAETMLKGAAQLVGGNVNRTTSDRFGWDCIIEFDQGESTLPPDLAPPGPAMLVQVKSSRSRERQCRIKLSNALRYVQHPLPYFIVLVGFQDGPEKPAIYVKHIWKPLFEQILGAARQAHKEGVHLHRRQIVIKFDEEDRADNDAVKFMVETVDSFGHCYTKDKQAAVSATGYNDVVAVGNFTVGPNVDPHTLVDASLGLIDAIDVRSFQLSDTRFGLAGTVPIIEGKEGLVSFRPHKVAECTCVLRRKDTREQISFDGEVYAPTIPNLPREYWKLRITTPFLNIGLRVGGSTTSDFSVSVDTEMGLSFNQLVEAATLRAWLGHHPLTLQVWLNGRVVSQGHMGIDASIKPDTWSSVHEYLRLLSSLAPASQIPKEPKLSVMQIVDSRYSLEQFRRVVAGPELEISFQFDSDPIGHDVSHYIAPYHIEIGEICFLAIVERPIASSDYRDSTVTLALGPPDILHGAILRGRAEDHARYIATEIDQLPDRPGHNALRFVPWSP